MSQSNQIVLCSSIICAASCLIAQHWIGPSSLPFYLPIIWAIVVTILSTWISCIVLRCSLRANSPIKLEPVSKWLRKKFEIYLKSQERPGKSTNLANEKEIQNEVFKELENLGNITNEIDAKYIQSWYKNISNDKRFPEEAKNLLQKLSIRLNRRLATIDKVKLVDKLSGVLLSHLKEYRR